MTSSMLDNMKGCFCFVAGSEWQKSVGGRLLHDDMRWKPRHCLQHQRSPLRVGSGTILLFICGMKLSDSHSSLRRFGGEW